jgi:hypothetical protein
LLLAMLAGSFNSLVNQFLQRGMTALAAAMLAVVWRR